MKKEGLLNSCKKTAADILENNKVRLVLYQGPFKCYVKLFSWKFDIHPPSRNASNVESYTFVTFFSGKFEAPHPTALRNT